MSDKDKEIADLIASAIEAGYKVTFERNDIGAVRNGFHKHIGFVDELLEEKGNSPFDYIEGFLQRRNGRKNTHHCGFDFVEGQATATCKCGLIATNPYYVSPMKGETES